MTQMIDFGLSVKDMMDDCLPLTVRVGDYALNILNIINHRRFHVSMEFADFFSKINFNTFCKKSLNPFNTNIIK